MKKIFIFIILLLLVSCDNLETNNIKIIMPQGAPSLAQIKIEHDNKIIDNYNLEIKRVGDPKLLQAAFVSEDYDLIYAPINMGVANYNVNKKYKVLASITEGNLYFLSKISINSISDLNNKNIYLFAKDSINDLVINRLFKEYNINANINYVASTQDTARMYLDAKEDDIYLIAEPVLSNLISKTKYDDYIFDINPLILDMGINFLQAAVFYKKDLDKDFIDKYYQALEESIIFVNNYHLVNEYLKDLEIGINNISNDAIKRTNIKLQRLNNNILNPLIDINKEIFKGYVDEDFYY